MTSALSMLRLRRYVRDESIDRVYLDPPFNSNATFNVLFGHHEI